jgi:membrane-associated protein
MLQFIGMIPGVDLVEFIKVVGIIGLTVMIFAESGLLIGFFLPGDTVIFTAGFLVSTHILHIDINLLALILFAAAVTGDSVGYTFGRRVGRKLFERPNSRFFRKEHLEKAEAFYEKHGGKTIVLARYIPAVRTFAPIVAGASKMSYKSFVTYNLLGGAGWVALNVYLGYFLGAWFESIGISIDQALLPLVFIILLISIAPAIVHLARDKKQRDALWSGTKRELAILLRKRSS